MGCAYVWFLHSEQGYHSTEQEENPGDFVEQQIHKAIQNGLLLTFKFLSINMHVLCLHSGPSFGPVCAVVVELDVWCINGSTHTKHLYTTS